MTMRQLNKSTYNKPDGRPIEILQFGEGNFLRAFVEWIVQDLNNKGIMNTGIAVVQPMPSGRIRELSDQDGLYTLCLEGIDNGKIVKTRQIIDCIDDYINPFTQYEKYIHYASSDDLKVIISNTTEAGIALDESDLDFSICPKSFPGKLLALLYARYQHFGANKDKGLAIIPCELIDYNGRKLKEVVNQLATLKGYKQEFMLWLNDANSFVDTLVDRIVPGYPKDGSQEIEQQIGYRDNNIVKAEVFHLWVISHDNRVEQVFPADKSGLNVIFAQDITPYKQRKVKVLNGSHTAMVPIAYMCGLDTVGQSIADSDIATFVRNMLTIEVKPTINLPSQQLDTFAGSVLERFANPFIRHELMSIALNSTTKFRTRLLDSFAQYHDITGKTARHILFSLANLAVFYRGVREGQSIALADNAEYLDFWKQAWQQSDLVATANFILNAEWVWGQDLSKDNNGILFAEYLLDITVNGARIALQNFNKD